MRITAHRRGGMKSFDVANGRSSDRKRKMPKTQKRGKIEMQKTLQHTQKQKV